MNECNNQRSCHDLLVGESILAEAASLEAELRNMLDQLINNVLGQFQEVQQGRAFASLDLAAFARNVLPLFHCCSWITPSHLQHAQLAGPGKNVMGFSDAPALGQQSISEGNALAV